MVVNKRWILTRYRKKNESMNDVLKLDPVEVDIRNLKENEVAVQQILLSMDPTYSMWSTNFPQYLPILELGKVFRGLTIGRVINSKNPKVPVGTWVSGVGGWQEYFIGTIQEGQFTPIPFTGKENLNLYFGLLGMVGMTAYFGFLDCCKPKPGDIVVVSGAAGAVGSLVGQIAKINGASKVIGIAGGADKCKSLIDEYGYDCVIDYKQDNIGNKLKEFAPEGVDCYFDNVGGDISEAVFLNMKLHGRISLCGQIAGYKDQSGGLKNYTQVLMKRLTIRGFIVFDYVSKYTAAMGDLAKWHSEGKLNFKIDERGGNSFDSAPQVCEDLFSGKNNGKLLIRLCPNNSAKL